jgi:hypothetical protein
MSAITTILFEPLPIARLGVRIDNEEVVVASDFSTFGFMLEEFISLGAINIALPKSSPEIRTLSKMPPMRRRRIKIVDDTVEREFVERVLHPIRVEFGVKIANEFGQLKFPKNLDQRLRESIHSAHRNVWRLALGFNHSLQVGITPTSFISAIKQLRNKSKDSESRLVLAQLAAFSNAYKDIQFDAPKPNVNVPDDLISIFDRLVNDPNYLEFSDAIGNLAEPKKRRGTLVRVKTASRKIMSSRIVTSTWNYAAKLIQVWTGAPIPEAGDLASFISDRSFPALVDLQSARKLAVKMWMSSSKTSEPCSRSGFPHLPDKILWLPPMKSIQASHPNALSLSMGTVGELKNALQSVEFLLSQKLASTSAKRKSRKRR